jgi:hypothetical protein
MAGQWLTADEQRAWRAYLRAGTLLRARLNRQLQADSGLPLPEYEVLVQLSEARRPAPPVPARSRPALGAEQALPSAVPDDAPDSSLSANVPVMPGEPWLALPVGARRGGFATHGTSWFGHQGPAG